LCPPMTKANAIWALFDGKMRVSNIGAFSGYSGYDGA